MVMGQIVLLTHFELGNRGTSEQLNLEVFCFVSQSARSSEAATEVEGRVRGAAPHRGRPLITVKP
jgi:hypothetical protein